MLLPISHEKMTVRRLPVITIAIIVVTVLLHGLASFGEATREQRAMGAMLEARILYLQHPTLGVCAPLKPFVGSLPALPDLRGLVDGAEAEPGDAPEVATQYRAACKDLAEATDGLAAQRYGYVPARANLSGLFTHMFVHADAWHVIGNMWFLFLCGLALEDRWGRPAFAAYYAVAGMVAAGVHHLLAGDPSAALIGASGAVAAAMGAFLVLFAKAKIRFVGLFAFRLVSFTAPAYVMLPMWAAVEVLYGLLASSSGTAHWAHTGGFLFGAAAASALRVFGVDRTLDDRVERVAVLGDDPRVDAARAMVARGESTQAVALLEGLAQEKSESIHVWQALRDAARASGDAAGADRASSHLLALEERRAGRTSAPLPLRSRPPASPQSVSTAAAAPVVAPFFPAPETDTKK